MVVNMIEGLGLVRGCEYDVHCTYVYIQRIRVG